ncbi:T9SS type A sorting domain-containing protein [Formosa sediminum]|uniref:T9SS type A sorting domain-containing protein n=1 Tax=Formosa sediminum TaxID=2594004 RepID=A0A516GVB9_9FLAO|nr:endonuclease [Formosa sediminum]QDO95446.1 T9SS type A sorting domain-containing protein [Formosa sediminum]
MVKQLQFLFLLLISTLSFAQTPEYYNSIDFTKTGEELKTELAELISTTHTTYIPYTSSTLDTWDALKTSDLDPDNLEDVLLFYGYNQTSTVTMFNRTRDKDLTCHVTECTGKWNREHVFPKSLANPNLDTSYPGAGTDVYNLRPADTEMNSLRSNRKFADGTGNASVTADGLFYPGDEWKGDVARIIMYMYLRYPTRCLPVNVGSGNAVYSDYGDMPDVFLKWNAEDPVSEVERNRNTEFESIQGNRNPFVDNPYLATLIWNGPEATDTWNTLSVNQVEVSDFKIYPTITTGYVYIQNTTQSKIHYQLYNILGQRVMSATTTDKIDLTERTKGIYILKINVNANNYNYKIVKK